MTEYPYKRLFVTFTTPLLLASSFLALLALPNWDIQAATPKSIQLIVHKQQPPPDWRLGQISPAIEDVVAQLVAKGITRDNMSADTVKALSTPWVKIDDNARIQVYVEVSSAEPREVELLREQGILVELAYPDMGVLQAWVPFDHVAAMARLPFVNRVRAPDYALPQSGSIITEGDEIIRADEIRELGLDGNGVRVGVISLGASNLEEAQATGDLPMQVAAFGPPCSPALYGVGCDEGTALLEIIHDIAPGANLAIGNVSTSLEFIDRVTEMVNDFGAHIVMDDLAFIGEPFFEDGPVATAVNAVTDKVLYITAAGNFAQSHYESGYVSKIVDGVDVHNFGKAAGRADDYSINIRIPPKSGIAVILQWNDPLGASANDYDLYLLNNSETNLLCPLTCVSNQYQTGFENPFEGIVYVNSSSTTQTGKILINRFSGQNRRLEMILLEFSGSTIVDEYNTPAGSVFGHAAVKKALTVGAISAEDHNHDNIEAFSSRGPARIDHPALQIRQKPDIAGIDRVSVSGAGGFPNVFIGTSAAAPHIAGIAALLKQRFFTASPLRLRKALKEGAFELGSPGVDNTFGWGRADADGAFSALKASTGNAIPWIQLLLEKPQQDQ